MAKSSNQKMKVLYIAAALLEQSDEDHPLTAADLIGYLAANGINAERKAIYDDIENLRTFGFCIENRRKTPSGFYISKRLFSEEELRLLSDAVQCAPFMPEKAADSILAKLRRLASVHRAPALMLGLKQDRHSGVLNSDVYDAIDQIRSAIESDVQVSFQYCEWTADKKLVPKRNGQRYVVSPWKILWNDGFCYLIAIEEKSRIVKHFRVDKIRKVQHEKDRRTGHDMFANFDQERFTAGTFHMFGGREETVTIEFENHLIGVLIDRFGEGVRVVSKDKEHFLALLRVRVSPQFFGWLAGLGAGAVITSPETAKAEYRRFLKSALASSDRGNAADKATG